MIINGPKLLMVEPIKDMASQKNKDHGVSWGLSEAGYDIRIKQDIKFEPGYNLEKLDETILYVFPTILVDNKYSGENFTIASTIEEFDMPTDMVGIVHDKSTWARQGLSVFNTVIEPGWKGFLTLELVFHGNQKVHIPAGSGIAQVVFHQTSNTMQYNGKYQNQEDKPIAPIMEI